LTIKHDESVKKIVEENYNGSREELDLDGDEVNTPIVLKKTSLDKRRNSLNEAPHESTKSEHKSSFHHKNDDDTDSVKFLSEYSKDSSPRSTCSEDVAKDLDGLGQLRFKSDVHDDKPRIAGNPNSIHKKSQFSNFKEEDESNFVLELEPNLPEINENETGEQIGSTNFLNISEDHDEAKNFTRSDKKKYSHISGSESEIPKQKSIEINTADTEKIIRINKGINKKRLMIKVYDTLIAKAKLICGQDPEQKSSKIYFSNFRTCDFLSRNRRRSE
jgi:hypothetical protein